MRFSLARPSQPLGAPRGSNWPALFSSARGVAAATSTFLLLSFGGASLAAAQSAGSMSTPEVISQKIDGGTLVSLSGNVLRVLTPDKDLGPVEDSSPQRLYLILKRTPAQQADLDSLLARQQQVGSPEYHKWLTPQQFGERFGVAQADVHKITIWLESQGFQVTSVAQNASVINFMASAGSIRNTFHAQLHYWNVSGGRYTATATEPQIPAALADVVSGIAGLNKLPMHSHHTPIKQQAYDAATRSWHNVDPTAAAALARGEQPHYTDGNGNYNMTPQDFYTIYNVNPTYAAGNTGAGATVAIVGEQDMMYGTVDPTTGKATGGDVVTFRNLFGVPGALNMTVQHGDTAFPCTDPGGDSGETALDAEWSSSLAPSAHLIVETCSPATGGLLTTIQALVDDNVADVISSSLGSSESATSDNSAYDMAFSQAAMQGQTILSAEGDSGSDDIDFGASGPATHGLSIDFPGSSPLVLSIGGTDFQDKYDVDRGSTVPQSTYWSSTNSKFYGDALSYVPETVWEDGCSNTIIALDPLYGNGLSPSAYCATGKMDGVEGGGEGGISIVYAQPSYQTGIPGLSASITKRATPDISGFAGGGFWGHQTVMCDSGDPNAACTSPSTFGGAGGTSFTSPELAGVFSLLKVGTGSRQGLVQPTLYALAKAQYSQSPNSCYANGQASNTGITTGLPASSCIFHDVTTGDNDNACVPGSTNCYTPSGDSIGILTASGNNSTLALAWPSGVNYDIATGLGSVNVTNLITKWNTAFTSNTSLTANPASITASQSTTLQATVTGAPPANYNGTPPALTGSVNFSAGGKTVGSCTLSGGTCSTSVAGSALSSGSNSVTATFTGSGTYPSSTSSVVTVTVTGGSAPSVTATPTFTPASGTYPASFTVNFTSSTPNAAIYYTTDGSTPTVKNMRASSGNVLVTASETVKAVAIATGFTVSAPVTATYVIQAGKVTATPTFTPVSGTEPGTITVTFTSATPNAAIYYSTDGSTPTVKYPRASSGRVTVSASETVKAVAIATGFTVSAPATATYTIK